MRSLARVSLDMATSKAIDLHCEREARSVPIAEKGPCGLACTLGRAIAQRLPGERSSGSTFG
jgi:hypothetical protein